MISQRMWKPLFLVPLLLTFDLLIGVEADETCSAKDGTCASTCKDNRTAPNECNFWAQNGECFKNPAFMEVECAKSCEICSPQLGTDMGVPQILSSERFRASSSSVLERFREARVYLKSKKVSPQLKGICRNQKDMCGVWAVSGECNKNPEFMKKECAPFCFSCDYLSIEGRCPIDPNAPKAWEPGDLNKMFERLSSEPYKTQHDVQILSRDPWVITMENVVLPEEADRLIELGGLEGYQRSHEVGKLKADGTYEKDTNTRRTSTNAWCQNECYRDETAQKVVHRLSNLTQIEERNSEYIQLLRYTEGQLYVAHHDYIAHHRERQQGVRILTMYLYLNDVEAGGGTNFDKLNITVMPKKGRALLWPSVLNEAPNDMDGRTTHQALPVEKGLKFGANAWFHMHDFKTPNSINCST